MPFALLIVPLEIFNRYTGNCMQLSLTPPRIVNFPVGSVLCCYNLCCYISVTVTSMLWMYLSSIIDQQQKQAIQFQRGVSLQELSDRILVASAHEIYALVPVPWQKQVRML